MANVHLQHHKPVIICLQKPRPVCCKEAAWGEQAPESSGVVSTHGICELSQSTYLRAPSSWDKR